MTVVCIGDSITYAEHLPRDRAWPTLLGELLNEPVFNEGVCADTTRLGLERFPDAVQARDPDSLVIQFGANDCNQWQTDEGLCRVSQMAFFWNLVEMVARARRFHVRHIVLCTIAPARKGPEFDHYARVYSELVRRAAYMTITGLYDPERDLAGRCGWVDAIHLDEETNRLYADGVAKAVRYARAEERVPSCG